MYKYGTLNLPNSIEVKYATLYQHSELNLAI